MSDPERKAKTPRKKETYRALRRTLQRANGGLSRKVPRNLLPPVGPGYSDPKRNITGPRRLERLRAEAT
jgi:hypothetical protein